MIEVSKRCGSRSGSLWQAGLAIAIVAGAGLAGPGLAPPARAQFSDSYKFLEAVRKKEGEKVESALADPGSTIINTRDLTSGETALHIVTNRRDLTWLQFLVGRGANVNVRDGQGRTPLQLATNLGWRDGVTVLLGQRANTEVANDAGETPLISAVHRRDLELAKLLLQAGADPDRADNSGRSARDYASLDGKSNPLLTLIQNEKRPDAGKANKPTYGPVF